MYCIIPQLSHRLTDTDGHRHIHFLELLAFRWLARDACKGDRLILT